MTSRTRTMVASAAVAAAGAVSYLLLVPTDPTDTEAGEARPEVQQAPDRGEEALHVYTLRPRLDHGHREAAKESDAFAAVLGGSVLVEGGLDRASGTVHVIGKGHGRETTIAWTKTERDGRFELALPLRARPYRVDVYARVNGYTDAVMKDVEIRQGRNRVDLHVAGGSAISGRIVEHRTGRTVGGVRVVATNDPVHLGREDAPYITEYSMTYDQPERFRSSIKSAYSVADEDGNFEIRGLHDGAYAILVDSDEWLVYPGCDVASGQRDVLVTAVKPLVLDVSAVAQGDGTGPGIGVDRFSVVVLTQWGKQPPGRSFFAGGRAGRAKLSWFEGRSGTQNSYQIHVKIQATGHATWYEKSPWPIETSRRREIRANLGRLAMRTVRIEAAYADGGVIDGSLAVSCTTAGSRSTFGPVIAKKDESGVFECRLPDANMFVEVQLVGPLQLQNGWQGEISQNGTGQSAVLRGVRIGRGGTVVVDCTGQKARPGAVLFVGERLSSSIPLETTVHTVEHVPGGEWELRIGSEAGTLRRSIVVEDGGTYHISF